MISITYVARWFAVSAAALVWSVTAVAQPTQMSLQLTYEVEWGNVDVAIATADWVFGEDSFELSATSRTVGLTDALRSYRGSTELSGRIEAGALPAAQAFHFRCFQAPVTGSRHDLVDGCRHRRQQQTAEAGPEEGFPVDG